jgi:predicted ATPase
LLFIIILEKQNVFVVIEEPEAHLFPEAQKEISNLIALMSNIENSQVFITTHSPYILASINNLILANKVGSVNKEVSERINRNLWVSRDKVYAAIVVNGQVKDIIDNELNIIQQENIDSVSGVINAEFDYLFQFETV